MKQAEKMCESVSEELKPQAIVLAEVVLALQKKIKEVTVGTGETILRNNPIVQEYRATVREYAQALEKLNALIKKSSESKPRTDKNSKIHLVGNSKWKKQA